jgi:alpha-galactosidase
MQETAIRIKEKGAKPGIWFRPLLTLGRVPNDAFLRSNSNGIVLDPSNPFTLEKVENDAKKIRNWGYEIIKHDFSTMDITGNAPLTSESHFTTMHSHDAKFFDDTLTTATIIKNFYKAVQKGAGDADVIGCNTIGHLTAGIHSVARIGNDTSGRSFEWTRRFGVHSFMRLPQNENFFLADPDCAAFTTQVDPNLNLDYLEACAITGMTTLASVTPYSLTTAQLKRINEIFKIADENALRYSIKNYDKNANPDTFISKDGKTTKEFNWLKAYEGARLHLDWFK